MLQNNFLGNSFKTKFSWKMFWSIIVCGCKIIPPGTPLKQKFYRTFFGQKCFMVAKSFPRKHLVTKIFLKYLLVENFLLLQNNFLGNRFDQNFRWKYLSRKFLWLQNYFHGNTFEPKIFWKIFRWKIFYGCKIISSETPLNQNFHEKFFGQ